MEISVSMPDAALEKFYEHDWDRQNEAQFEALTRIIRRIGPSRITVNVSAHNYAYTDGLSHGLYLQMKEELPEDITTRFVSSDEAGIRLMETRTETELKYWPHVMETAGGIIEEAFSVFSGVKRLVDEEEDSFEFSDDIAVAGLIPACDISVDVCDRDTVFGKERLDFIRSKTLFFLELYGYGTILIERVSERCKVI